MKNRALVYAAAALIIGLMLGAAIPSKAKPPSRIKLYMPAWNCQIDQNAAALECERLGIEAF